MLGELSKLGLMLQWHLRFKTQQVLGELKNLWLLGEQRKTLRLRLGDLRTKMEARLKIDLERRDVSNVAMKAICRESVLMEINNERELASSAVTRAICLENVLMATVGISPEREAVSNVEEKVIEPKIALENKLKLNLKMRKDLEEEDASNAEMKVIEQENALEKEEINLKNKDQDEEEKMKIQI